MTGDTPATATPARLYVELAPRSRQNLEDGLSILVDYMGILSHRLDRDSDADDLIVRHEAFDALPALLNRGVTHISKSIELNRLALDGIADLHMSVLGSLTALNLDESGQNKLAEAIATRLMKVAAPRLDGPPTQSLLTFAIGSPKAGLLLASLECSQTFTPSEQSSGWFPGKGRQVAAQIDADWIVYAFDQTKRKEATDFIADMQAMSAIADVANGNDFLSLVSG